MKSPIYAYHAQIAPERQLIKIVLNLFEVRLKFVGFFYPLNKASSERKYSKT